TQPIEWSSSPVGAISNVKIEIDREGFGEWETLFSSVTNNGVTGWVVTSPATTSAIIRVSDASNAAINDVSDAVFTITGGEEGGDTGGIGDICTTNDDCDPGLECPAGGGTCQEPGGDEITGCFTDAYWENATSGAKIMGTNDDDLFIAGNISKSVAEGCNDIGIFIKDYTNDNTVKSGFGVPEGSSRETLSWTTEYNAASGYSRYYFIASTVGAEDGADSRSGTGAGLIKVFKQEPLEGGSCEDYDSQEVCSDDPWGIADGGSGGEGSCSWDDVTSICNQGDIVVPPGPDGQGGGTCSYSQNTTDTCEDDGHLSFQMVARWSGDDPQPEWCKDKPQNVVECPAQIALPFWGAYNVLIISLVIVFAYAAIILSKKKRLLGISLPRIRFAFI
ncbi:MAG: hypothetical protein Q8P81_01280, partial [Nanoarchaeota archaeon]|nr:hypothetical protein [Nanoarchaeota archaeon]